MMRELTFNGHRINDESDCFVVAEIGNNHQGDVNIAKELFHAAKECGVDAVKLQKRDNRSLFTAEMFDQPYVHRNSFGRTYGEHREFLEFGLNEYHELKHYAKDIDITLFATAFDIPSADFIAELDLPAFKIASGDLKSTPLLQYVAAFQKPMFVSTGGGTMDDVQRAYDTIMPINTRLCLLQCTSGYPSAFEELNLRAIATYRERFPEAVIGLSAHDSGIAMATAGYVLGARVVEKHFTLNRAMRGTDHAFSLERPGMKRLVRDLRRVHVALGDGRKRPYSSEQAPLYKMAKKLVTARELPTGHKLTIEDIAIKSPNDGLPPYEIENVIGKVTRRALQTDENISFEDLVDSSR